MMRSFGKVYKDRTQGLREGPIYVYVQAKTVFLGALFLICGAIVSAITQKLTNTNLTVDMQACPALDGLIHTWISTMGNVCIILGLLGFAMGGVVSKLFLFCQLRDEAICCGKMFMGLVGKVLSFVGFTGLLLYNVHGTFVMREALKSGVQSESQWPLDSAKTYCSSIILTLFKIMNYGVYTFFGLSCILSMVFCYMKISKFREDSDALPEFGIEATKMAKVFGVIETKKKKKAKKGAISSTDDDLGSTEQ